MDAPICIAVHGMFADKADEVLSSAGARIVTSNSVPHRTNEIDITILLRSDVIEFTRAQCLAAIMSTPYLALNAGSSSLKFALFREDADAKLGAVLRGQIEGMPANARFTAKDGLGTPIFEKQWADGRTPRS